MALPRLTQGMVKLSPLHGGALTSWALVPRGDNVVLRSGNESVNSFIFLVCVCCYQTKPLLIPALLTTSAAFRSPSCAPPGDRQRRAADKRET